MNISKLIFFPKSTNAMVNTPTLLHALINTEFIIEKTHKQNHYLPGEHFLSLITFLGCSPSINLLPVEGENHCFISFIKPTEQAHCVGYTTTVNPKCPACTKRIAHWEIPDGKIPDEKKLDGKTKNGKTTCWQQPGKLCTCDKCKQQTPYADLNWKQECGFARCGFEVNHIYPHEAVPTEQLLETLNKFSNFEWDYCYTTN